MSKVKWFEDLKGIPRSRWYLADKIFSNKADMKNQLERGDINVLLNAHNNLGRKTIRIWVNWCGAKYPSPQKVRKATLIDQTSKLENEIHELRSRTSLQADIIKKQKFEIAKKNIEIDEFCQLVKVQLIDEALDRLLIKLALNEAK